ncbi:hypothetical protein MFIFM68171_09625 [Madurella fahalii]|uniref:Uncharacterized protein n=1 Tax=Madurella fahalii TaxID=1157608 RepID=A0ABQ0GNW6_9PEZI
MSSPSRPPSPSSSLSSSPSSWPSSSTDLHQSPNTLVERSTQPTTLNLAIIDNSSLAKNKDTSGLCVGCGNNLPAESHGSPQCVSCDNCGRATWCSPACAFGGCRGTAPNGSNMVLWLGSYDTHLQLCSQRAFAPPKLPSEPKTRRRCRALLFPTNKERAKAVWVDYDTETAALDIDTVALKDFEIIHRRATSSELSLAYKVILQKDSTGYSNDVAHSIAIIYYPPEGVKMIPSFVNKSIAALGKPQQLKTWRGPLVAIAVSHNPGGKYCFVEPFDPIDLSRTVGWFRDHKDNIGFPALEAGSRYAWPVLKMTDRMHTFLSVAFGPLPSMTEIQMNMASPAFHRSWLPCIAAHRLGLPWYIAPANSESWDIRDYEENDDARWLNILIRDAERMPVHPEHVNMLNQYLDSVSKQNLAYPTTEGFLRFCKNHCARQLAAIPPSLLSSFGLEPTTDTRDMLQSMDLATIENETFWTKFFRLHNFYSKRQPLSVARDRLDSLFAAAHRIMMNAKRSKAFAEIADFSQELLIYHDLRTGHILGLQTGLGILRIEVDELGEHFCLDHKLLGGLGSPESPIPDEDVPLLSEEGEDEDLNQEGGQEQA